MNMNVSLWCSSGKGQAAWVSALWMSRVGRRVCVGNETCVDGWIHGWIDVTKLTHLLHFAFALLHERTNHRLTD
jgi:hypothetical protein